MADNKFELDSREPEQAPFYSRVSSDEELKKQMQEKATAKLLLFKKVKEISNGEWLITQEILQDIQANYIATNPEGRMLSSRKLSEALKTEIEERFKEDEEKKQLLLDSIPSDTRLRDWMNKTGWEEAVWNKIRNSELFNKGKRSSIINALYKRAIEGSDTAAKIWLTLSGDYSDKMDINSDKRVDTYREVNQILHNKKD